jgi:hypothetical protein
VVNDQIQKKIEIKRWIEKKIAWKTGPKQIDVYSNGKR